MGQVLFVKALLVDQRVACLHVDVQQFIVLRPELAIGEGVLFGLWRRLRFALGRPLNRRDRAVLFYCLIDFAEGQLGGAICLLAERIFDVAILDGLASHALLGSRIGHQLGLPRLWMLFLLVFLLTHFLLGEGGRIGDDPAEGELAFLFHRTRGLLLGRDHALGNCLSLRVLFFGSAQWRSWLEERWRLTGTAWCDGG